MTDKEKTTQKIKDSRVGRRPITIPQGVKITISEDEVIVKGKKGELKQDYKSDFVNIKEEDGKIIVSQKINSKQARAFQGLYRALLQNMVTGVTDGFVKELIIRGLGYRANVEGKTIKLLLGYSHPIDFTIPEGIEIEVEKAKGKEVPFKVLGIDRQLVGQVAANIRKLRKPDAYKGAGIRYADEELKLKQGKKTGA